MKPYFEFGSISIYHGDSREILPKLGRFDLLLTDPPYGIGYEASRYRGSSFEGIISGDEIAFDPSLLLGVSEASIIWGANNFCDKLPIGGWLCWDKRGSEIADKIPGSPFELAWCSRRTTFKMTRIVHCGAVNDDGAGMPRWHPTMKPLRLMKWCVSLFPQAKTVLDPFMGSGTTLRAAKDAGLTAVGIEREEKYCEIAAKRMAQEVMEFV
jgi:DNA modification methylase